MELIKAVAIFPVPIKEIGWAFDFYSSIKINLVFLQYIISTQWIVVAKFHHAPYTIVKFMAF